MANITQGLFYATIIANLTPAPDQVMCAALYQCAIAPSATVGGLFAPVAPAGQPQLSISLTGAALSDSGFVVANTTGFTPIVGKAVGANVVGPDGLGYRVVGVFQCIVNAITIEFVIVEANTGAPASTPYNRSRIWASGDVTTT